MDALEVEVRYNYLGTLARDPPRPCPVETILWAGPWSDCGRLDWRRESTGTKTACIEWLGDQVHNTQPMARLWYMSQPSNVSKSARGHLLTNRYRQYLGR